MSINYYLKADSRFDLVNYKIQFARQQFMTKVDGELEIVGDFKLPIDAFKLHLNLPSQRLEGHVLTESDNSCSTSHSVNEGCRVYRWNSWLN